MPLYEYQCDVCSNRFERIQKFSDPPIETCPSCGGTVKKLLSSPAIQFKGSGWYITDYAKKSPGPQGKTSGSDASGGSTNESGSSASNSSSGGSASSGSGSSGSGPTGPPGSGASGKGSTSGS